MLRRQIFQNINPSGIGARFALLTTGKRHFIKEHFTKLFGGSHIKAAPGHLVDFSLQPRHLLRETIRHAAQDISVYFDPVHFHICQYRHEGAFQAFIDRCHPIKMQARFEILPKAQSDIGIFCRIKAGLINGNAVKGDCGFPTAQQCFDRDGRMIEITLAQKVHPMIVQAAILRVAHQHCVIDRRHLDADPRQNLGVIFHVLTDFQNGGIFQHRLEHGQSGIEIHLALRQSISTEEIIRLPCAMRER